MSEPELHQGGCLCGAVRYRAAGRPRRVGLCHCETCRRNTGAPVAGFAIFARAGFEVVGETGFFAATPAIRRHFCPRCGAPLFHEEGEEVNIHLGSLDEPAGLAPTYELFADSRLPWLPQFPGVRAYARFRD